LSVTVTVGAAGALPGFAIPLPAVKYILLQETE
jgi:hypothetical protein